jgi:hypothetical protein
MSDTIATLRAIHAQTCKAISKANRRPTPADEAFWPLYIRAALDVRPEQSNAPRCSEDEVRDLGGESV